MTDDRQFVQRLSKALDAGQDALDPAIRRRLREARHAALEQLGPRRSLWQPVAAFAIAASLVAAVLWWPGSQTALPATALQDVDVIAIDDSLQLYEELEFYEWLAVADVEAG
jgi:hypothetical protein